MMKKQWTSPRVLVQEFEANEYVAACWGVGCATTEAMEYEKKIHNTNGIDHKPEHCGLQGNQVLKDDNNDGIPEKMIETGTDGLGDLGCDLFERDYTTPVNIANVRPGQYIYWTTKASDGRTWHHQGEVISTVPGHPNRS